MAEVNPALVLEPGRTYVLEVDSDDRIPTPQQMTDAEIVSGARFVVCYPGVRLARDSRLIGDVIRRLRDLCDNHGYRAVDGQEGPILVATWRVLEVADAAEPGEPT